MAHVVIPDIKLPAIKRRKAGVFLNRCPRRCGTSGSSGQHGTVLGGRISCIADADVGVVEQGGAQVKARGGASVCALADGIMPSCLSRFSAGNLSVRGLLDRWRKSSSGDQVISPTWAYLDREAYILAERTAEEIAARLARRKERQQNQREANFERANKMHKVRLASPDAAEVMAADPLAGSIHIGCSGWYYWHWKGNFYPAEVPANRWFAIYQDHFSTVELNAPFYSWPTVSAVKTWIRQAEPNFIYTIKVCELITHIKRFEDTAILIKDFGYIADLLGSQMGCFLFQLPPSVRYSPELLHSIISQLDPRCRNVVEFRHKSWWNANVYQAFNAAQVIFCSCVGPGCRMNSYGLQTTSMLDSTGSSSGIAMTTATTSLKFGPNAYTHAAPRPSGFISTMIGTVTPLRTRVGCQNCSAGRDARASGTRASNMRPPDHT